MTEVFNAKEGTLAWVQASGSGRTWGTASGATGREINFVEGFTFSEPVTNVVIKNRGVVSHHKRVSDEAITLSFDRAMARTASLPDTPTSGGGHSVPLMNFEFKMTAPADGAAVWMQFYGVAIDNLQFSENPEYNIMNFAAKALAVGNWTGSGYLIP